MKTKLAIIILGLSAVLASAQTNQAEVSTLKTNAVEKADKDFGAYELTLGGGGVKNSWGLDLSLSTNPFKRLSSLWLGVGQSVAWEPKFSGSTDLFADWGTHLIGQLYINTGWSVGALYDTHALDYWRTGPEVTFEYYVGDSSFLFAGANYDAWRSHKSEDDHFRFSWGLGITW
jgi:hypothetical protein